jgi:hypothetical protein
MSRIAECSDPIALKVMLKNAQRHAQVDVVRAARLRLYAVSPKADPGTLEHDVWQSILALEDSLSEERGKTVRLGRTRPKIARDGEQKTVVDLVSKPSPSEGFAMLIERGMLELTFEAVALRHPERFEADILAQCKTRLAPFMESGGIVNGQ